MNSEDEMKFSSEDEALQYLANLTGNRVVISDKIKTATVYSYVFEAQPTGVVLKDVLMQKFKNKTIGVKKGNERLQIGAIELIGGTAFLIAVKNISSIDKDLLDEVDKEEEAEKDQEDNVITDVRTRGKIMPY
jgi:hypothetical protein